MAGKDKKSMEKYLGQDIPKLGFGLMRLPMINDSIDIEQVKDMTDLFLAKGFRYFDTAYGYNNGDSERAAKKALVERYPREEYLLATKLPAWAGPKTKEEAQRMLYTSLERTGAGYFDFYLLHNLGETRTESFDRFDIWNFLSKTKQAGLIRHLGFSIHDKAQVLDKILTEHPEMEFVQLQINYADWDNPRIESRLCYEVARKHGKPVIIMEPVKGGLLASPPPAVGKILKDADPGASTASWAMRFAASLDGVITVLSGMSDMAQMEDNISYMSDFKPLSKAERETISRAQSAISDIASIPCTSCAYCMDGCPQSIAIPGIFGAMNMLTVYKDEQAAKGSYFWSTKGINLSDASACIECGHCESVCPQHISIIEELKNAAGALG